MEMLSLDELGVRLAKLAVTWAASRSERIERRGCSVQELVHDKWQQWDWLTYNMPHVEEQDVFAYRLFLGYQGDPTRCVLQFALRQPLQEHNFLHRMYVSAYTRPYKTATEDVCEQAKI